MIKLNDVNYQYNDVAVQVHKLMDFWVNISLIGLLLIYFDEHLCVERCCFLIDAFRLKTSSFYDIMENIEC